VTNPADGQALTALAQRRAVGVPMDGAGFRTRIQVLGTFGRVVPAAYRRLVS